MPRISNVPQELSDVPQSLSDEPERRRTSLRAAREPGLLSAGAVLLMCAPVLPGLSRLVVLPALLLAPGYALLRVLGRALDRRSISIAIPASLVLIILASLFLDVSGIPLSPVSLGVLLGAVTALFLAGSYARQLGVVTALSLAASHARQRATGRWHGRTAARQPEAVRENTTVGERKVTRP